jgi:myo-inositol-1(or 4)-monophosphatase
MKNTLIKAAQEAGKIIKENFAGTYVIKSKDSVSNLVTEIDNRSEAKIIEVIKSDFPDHNILSEEIGALTFESDTKWIIDPIDGTINYAHSIPLCCVSIGIEKAGELLMGAIYNPMSEEFFFAEKGQGAFLNDAKISVSKTKKVESSLLVTGFPYDTSKNPNKPLDLFAKFILSDVPVRRLGSAALDICWVAAGRFDGFWEYRLNPWDVAAGVVILREAGGKISDFHGGEYSVYGKEILGTNGILHEEMLAIIKGVIDP